MFMPHPSLGHQEEKLFAPREFIKLIMLRLPCLWISFITLIMSFKKASKFVEKKQLHKAKLSWGTEGHTDTMFSLLFRLAWDVN